MTKEEGMIRLYEKVHGYTPVKSKNCCGCPSWPFAPCLRCGDENMKMYKEHCDIHCGDEGDW